MLPDPPSGFEDWGEFWDAWQPAFWLFVGFLFAVALVVWVVEKRKR